SLVGTVARDGAGEYVVSGTPVQAKESMLVSGSEVLVKGKWNGRQLIADSAQQDPSLHFAEHGRQVVVEGLVVERMPGEQMKISGFDIDYSNSTLVAGGSMGQLMQGHLVRVTGQVQAGRRLQANRIEIMRRPEIVSHMFGVMLGEQGRKHNAGMTQSMPTQMKHNRASHPDPLRRPMPTTGQNRPMPMMKHGWHATEKLLGQGSFSVCQHGYAYGRLSYSCHCLIWTSQTEMVEGCQMSAHRLRRVQATTARSGLKSGNP
ncbi:MAG: DUF5666 domain-containing protein, partial [Candidatus Gracilibacteria bacterium]